MAWIRRRIAAKVKRALAPVRRRVDKALRAATARRAAEAANKAEADRVMAAAVEKGLRVVSPADIAEINANPKLARRVNEEAAVRAAAEYGVNIRKPNGKIDMRLARKAAEAAAIQATAAMGFDIRDKRGKIDRRKAMVAARAAQDARDGKPVDPRVKAYVEQQDSRLAEMVRAAHQRGLSVDQVRIGALKSDPALANATATEMVIQAAEAAGVNVFQADGKTLNPAAAQRLADTHNLRMAAELGIDVAPDQTRLTRQQAREAGRLIAAARAGKPASAETAATVSRQDAAVIAAMNAAARRAQPDQDPLSRHDAVSDAKLAAVVRQDLLRKIR
jgi:hypothetical protein